MSQHVNLLRDDFEAVAERISEVVRRRPRKQMVLVSDRGKVRIDNVCKMLSLEVPTHTILGTYDRQVRIETLEGDLIERLRELQSIAA